MIIYLRADLMIEVCLGETRSDYIKLEQKCGDPGRQCTRWSGALSSATKKSRSASAQQMMQPQHPEESDESENYPSAKGS